MATLRRYIGTEPDSIPVPVGQAREERRVRGHTAAGETEGTAFVLPVSRKGTLLPSRGREFRVIAERFSGERASRAYSYRFPTPWRVNRAAERGRLGWNGGREGETGLEREDGSVKTALAYA